MGIMLMTLVFVRYSNASITLDWDLFLGTLIFYTLWHPDHQNKIWGARRSIKKQKMGDLESLSY